MGESNEGSTPAAVLGRLQAEDVLWGGDSQAAPMPSGPQGDRPQGAASAPLVPATNSEIG